MHSKSKMQCGIRKHVYIKTKILLSQQRLTHTHRLQSVTLKGKILFRDPIAQPEPVHEKKQMVLPYDVIKDLPVEAWSPAECIAYAFHIKEKMSYSKPRTQQNDCILIYTSPAPTASIMITDLKGKILLRGPLTRSLSSSYSPALCVIYMVTPLHPW